MTRSLAASVVASLLLAGCAGTGTDFGSLFPAPAPATDDVSVTSDPSGAQARSSTGQSCPSTPCVLKVPVNVETATITVSRQGFVDTTAEIRFLTSGGEGEGVEPTRGFFPNPVTVALEPAPPPPPRGRQGRPPARTQTQQPRR